MVKSKIDRDREATLCAEGAKLILSQGGKCCTEAARIMFTMGCAAENVGLTAVMRVVLAAWSDIALSAVASGVLPDTFDPARQLTEAAEHLRGRQEKIASGELAPTASIAIGADALRHAAPAGSA
jgi:hypothetical protein